MKTETLDYHLPEHCIAQHALADRAGSRLLIMNRSTGDRVHRHFADLPDWLERGDCLVLNDSRVIPARFFARRRTGGRIEGLFLRPGPEGDWQVLLKNAGRLRPSERLELIRPSDQDQPDMQDQAPPDSAQPDETISLEVVERLPRGQWRLRPPGRIDHLAILERYGLTPLPPYIRRPGGQRLDADRQRYQTVYADAPGSVAAPTAGLHFDQPLLERLADRGLRLARLTLHVGLGTFQPVETESLEDHPMHAEEYRLEADQAACINRTLDEGKRVVAVGTTSVRTLEAVAAGGRVRPGAGWTDLLITPGYTFRIVKGLITNFHLPRTTLLALVCALAGTERIQAAYREAIEQGYRFYSYGDAMLIL